MKAFGYCLYLTLVISTQLCAMTHNNALVQAVFNDNLQKVIRILATEDVDINYQGNCENYNPTALHIAATGNNDVIVQLLLEAGASVHARNHWGQTPLHAFAIGIRFRKPNNKILQLLLQAGADIHAQDNDGMTPLHVAGYYLNKETAGLLLKLPNINIFARNNKNKTAFGVAKEHIVFCPDERERKQEMVAFLSSAYAEHIKNNRDRFTQDLQEEIQQLLR